MTTLDLEFSQNISFNENDYDNPKKSLNRPCKLTRRDHYSKEPLFPNIDKRKSKVAAPKRLNRGQFHYYFGVMQRVLIGLQKDLENGGHSELTAEHFLQTMKT